MIEKDQDQILFSPESKLARQTEIAAEKKEFHLYAIPDRLSSYEIIIDPFLKKSATMTVIRRNPSIPVRSWSELPLDCLNVVIDFSSSSEQEPLVYFVGKKGKTAPSSRHQKEIALLSQLLDSTVPLGQIEATVPYLSPRYNYLYKLKPQLEKIFKFSQPWFKSISDENKKTHLNNAVEALKKLAREDAFLAREVGKEIVKNHLNRYLFPQKTGEKYTEQSISNLKEDLYFQLLKSSFPEKDLSSIFSGYALPESLGIKVNKTTIEPLVIEDYLPNYSAKNWQKFASAALLVGLGITSDVNSKVNTSPPPPIIMPFSSEQEKVNDKRLPEISGFFLSVPKGEVSPAECPAPLDIGTALRLVNLRHPDWERKLLPAISGFFIQTSTRWENQPKEKPVPAYLSCWDYVQLSDKHINEATTYIISRLADGKVSYERVKRESITLDDGTSLKGYVITKERVKPNQVGVLKKIWITVPPDKNKEISAGKIGTFYIIADGKISIVMKPEDLAQFCSTYLFGNYYDGAFIYDLPVSFSQSLEIVFEGTGKAEPDFLWYRVEGVKLDKELLPPELLLQANWENHPDLWGDHIRFKERLQKVSPGIVKEDLPRVETAELSPWTNTFRVEKNLQQNQLGRLSLLLEDYSQLDSCSVEITYSEEKTPAIKGTLRQFLGLTHTGGNRFFSTRFFSLEKGSKGGIVFKLAPFPMPKDTKIAIFSSDSQKYVNFTLESKEENSLPKQRLRFYHYFLPMDSPTEHSVTAELGLEKTIITGQLQLGIDGYKATPVSGLWPRGTLEGNSYIVAQDGSLVPISTGFEDFGDAAFYDWALKPVSPGNPLPLADNMFFYGPGKFINDQAVIDFPYEAWAMTASSMNLVLRPGEKIRIDPYHIKGREAANVSLSLWGWSID